jgi:CheY-like chemotaxis protein/HPt (histidine-containing phosphotransfer) domain-containing protein
VLSGGTSLIESNTMNVHRSGPRDPRDANAPLDGTRLADVLRGHDRPASAFLAEFRRSTDADVQQLLDACMAADLVRVERLAHRIDGACRIIGAGPMAQACRLVARVAGSGEPGALRPAIDVLLESRQALAARLDQLHPAASLEEAGGDGNKMCAGMVFLVAEDHEFQRGMIMRLLRQLGALEVHGFADGASALAAAREVRSPAILILDLAMPGLGGMDVMRIVGQERLPVSVIVNSALGEDLLRRQLQLARSSGVAVLGAVSKPLTAAKLVPLLPQQRHDKSPGACSRDAANDRGSGK